MLGETIVIIFAELEKFRKSEDECQTRLERMLYILKNSGKLHIPPKWSGYENYTDILDACEIETFDSDKRIKYDSDMYDEKRLKGVMDAARDDGRAEGREEAQVEMARKFKALGVDIDTIVQATGLDREIVEQI